LRGAAGNGLSLTKSSEQIDLSCRFLAFDLRRHAKRDRDPVPAINGNRGGSEVNNLLFGEFLTRGFDNVIGYVALRRERDGLHPAQRCALARAL
jgi:hypothetical protein